MVKWNEKIDNVYPVSISCLLNQSIFLLSTINANLQYKSLAKRREVYGEKIIKSVNRKRKIQKIKNKNKSTLNEISIKEAKLKNFYLIAWS